jgi:hypothetical protein
MNQARICTVHAPQPFTLTVPEDAIVDLMSRLSRTGYAVNRENANAHCGIASDFSVPINRRHWVLCGKRTRSLSCVIVDCA